MRKMGAGTYRQAGGGARTKINYPDSEKGPGRPMLPWQQKVAVWDDTAASPLPSVM